MIDCGLILVLQIRNVSDTLKRLYEPHSASEVVYIHRYLKEAFY